MTHPKLVLLGACTCNAIQLCTGHQSKLKLAGTSEHDAASIIAYASCQTRKVLLVRLCSPKDIVPVRVWCEEWN